MTAGIPSVYTSTMKVKNDYTNCLTNLACSVQKYFDIPYAHTTLSDIDALLAEQQPENVVVFLLDGMGDNILSRNLPSTSFFRSNRLRTLYSVFPATTTACTMSMLTGLNPVEHGWLGWDMYVKPLDKTMTLFLGIEKVSKERESDYISKTSDLVRKYLPEQIADAGKYDGVLLAPFIDPKYRDFDVLTADVQAACSKPAKNEKRYVYAYYPDPDGIMHDKGPDSDEVKHCMATLDEKIAVLCNELHNTVVIVVADHGHMKTEQLMLSDYPDVEELLERTPGLEQRAASFKVKDGCQEEFARRFNTAFGKDFDLYPAEEVIASGLFGNVSGVPGGAECAGENPLFRPALGDFVAINGKSNRSIVSEGGSILFSEHAGWTDDEIIVPLIVKVCR